MDDTRFDFQLKDTKTADQVLKEFGEKISSWTRGMVQCEVLTYEGETESYTRKSGFAVAAEAFAHMDGDITVDIQNTLGEQSEIDNKFEVCLTVKGLEYYKYRLMFIRYGAIAYPVKVIMNEDIAKAYAGKEQYKYIIDSMSELENMIEQVFATEYCTKLIQSLIYEAMRQENKNND